MQEFREHDGEINREFYEAAFEEQQRVMHEHMEARMGVAKERGATLVRRVEKLGRNDPCPCDSGLKYKKCCISKAVRLWND